MADIQGVQENKQKLIIKCRHISPPPTLNASAANEENATTTQTADEDIVSTHSKLNASKNSRSLFKFPFQRRARSLSLPKDKDGNDQTVPTEHTHKEPPNFTIIGKKQKSPSPPARDVALNKPILAKDNFVLAHKNLIPGVKNLLKQQEDMEIMMGKCKEVEEWLMGSGESAETAASQGLKCNFKLAEKNL
jgi:hypothetical protein